MNYPELNGIDVTNISLHRESGSQFSMRVQLEIILDERKPESRIVMQRLTTAMTMSENFRVGSGNFAAKLRQLADECDAEAARAALQKDLIGNVNRSSGAALDAISQSTVGVHRIKGETDIDYRDRILAAIHATRGFTITPVEFQKLNDALITARESIEGTIDSLHNQ